MPDAPVNRRVSLPKSGEDGFTLLELVIAITIAGILLAMAFHMFSSGKNAANANEAIAVGRMYSDAIEGFKADHAGRVPDLPGSDDWKDAAKGPVLTLGSTVQRGYLRAGVPEAVSSGKVTIQSSTGSSFLMYRKIDPTPPATVATAYVLEVYTAEKPDDPVCIFGQDTIAIPKCR